jgi:hypothetical protein
VTGAVTPGASYATGTMAGTDNGNGTAALVLGILGIIGCLPFLGSILAIILGKSGMNKADQGRANNRGVAQAGFILGIVGLVLSVIGIIVWILIFAAASTSSSY